MKETLIYANPVINVLMGPLSNIKGESKMIFYIYKYTNLVNNKKYVG